MTKLKQLYDDLHHCYGCTLPKSCVGCPYNGCKAEILQYLKDLNGNFTNRERELLLLGIRNCIVGAGLVMQKYNTQEIQAVMNNFNAELQDLSNKISQDRSIVTCGECVKCATDKCHFYSCTSDVTIGPQEDFFCADGVKREDYSGGILDY
jgi:hypothetical protein